MLTLVMLLTLVCYSDYSNAFINELLQAEDSSVTSDRWSMILDNISVIIPQYSDCSSAHVRSVAEFLLSTVVDCHYQLRR